MAALKIQLYSYQDTHAISRQQKHMRGAFATVNIVLFLTGGDRSFMPASSLPVSPAFDYRPLFQPDPTITTFIAVIGVQ